MNVLKGSGARSRTKDGQQRGDVTIARVLRDEPKKVKAHMELRAARDIGGNHGLWVALLVARRPQGSRKPVRAQETRCGDGKCRKGRTVDDFGGHSAHMIWFWRGTGRLDLWWERFMPVP